jgi:hypothetical protein
MISYLNFRNGLKKIVKPAAALLLATSALALSNSTGSLLGPVTTPHHNGPPVVQLPWLPLHLHHHHRPPTAPEANAGLVLIPIVVAVMLLSSRQILRRRSEAK